MCAGFDDRGAHVAVPAEPPAMNAMGRTEITDL
jgi:hypothetical protein